VITVKANIPVVDAQKLMKEHKLRRLPVVDDSGKPIGIVTQERLDTIKPSTGAPLVWQVHYLIAHTTVGDIMRKEVVTVKPTDSVEYAIAKAQSSRVGTIVVVEEDKIVGICTTNDFFYGIVNPLLGIGEKGSRIIIIGGGDVQPASEIISYINKKGLKTKVIWAITSPTINKNNLILHLETEDPAPVVAELNQMGYEANIVQR
jgi:acetoin utilization protein AcuB